MTLTRTAHDELLLALDADLREHVQRSGVDPQRDVSAVRRLAERVVGDHDQRSLTGAVRPVADPEATVEALVANVAGFGPLQRHLDGPEVEELRVNDPSRVSPEALRLACATPSGSDGLVARLLAIHPVLRCNGSGGHLAGRMSR